MNSCSKKNPLIERIIKLRVQHFGKRGKSNFARQLDISPSTYNYYEQDRIPPAHLLLKMSQVTGCSLEWLISGKKKFADASKNNKTGGSADKILSKIDTLLEENPQLGQPVMAFLEILCEKNDLEKTFFANDVNAESTGNLPENPVKAKNAVTMENPVVVENVIAGGNPVTGGDVVPGENVVGVESVAKPGNAVVGGNVGTAGNAVAVDNVVKAEDSIAGESVGTAGNAVGGVAGNGVDGGDGLGGLAELGVGLIPVLGRTAAGVVNSWQQYLADGEQACEKKLSELVREYLASDIVSSESCEMAFSEQYSGVSRLSGVGANLVSVSGDGSGITEFVECGELARRYQDCFALRVDGDSMMPKICDGDIVVLSPCAGAKQSCAAVVKVKDQIGVTCKMIRFEGQKVHLVAINEDYETHVIDKKDLVWALAVLGKIQF